MKTNTSPKISLLLSSTIVLIALNLVACIPQQSATIQPLISPTAEGLPTQQDTQIPTAQTTATNTPVPTPTNTPEPVADLHDLSTWPVEMQDFFNRPPDEWNNSSKQYVSGAEFNLFFQQTRRDFLTRNGIETSKKTDHEIMLEYQRWAFENKEIMTWSPQEIALGLGGPFRIAYIEGTERNAPVHGGIFLSSHYRSNPGNDHLAHVIAEHQYSIDIFGVQVQRPPSSGIIAIYTGVIKIPGVNIQDEILIYLTYREDGVNFSNLVSIPLQPTNHNKGDVSLDLNGNLTIINNSFSLQPAITGLCSGGQDICLNGRKMTFISLENLINEMGTVTIVNPYYAGPTDLGGFESIGDLSDQHIERGYTVGFNQSNLIDMSFPWDD